LLSAINRSLSAYARARNRLSHTELSTTHTP